MGRSGYSEDGDYDNPAHLLWLSVIERSIKGRRGQAFLQALAKEMDAMPVKALIAGELVTKEGDCCAMGVICKARGIDVSEVEYEDPAMVAQLFDIAPALAGEIAYQNDDDFGYERHDKKAPETPEERWTRMRKWVQEKLDAARGEG